jgi:hypothetical protein
MSLQHIEM